MKILIMLAVITVYFSSNAHENDPIPELTPEGVYITSYAEFQNLDTCLDQKTTSSEMIEPGYSIVVASFVVMLNPKTEWYVIERAFSVKDEVLKTICDDIANIDKYTFTITNLDVWSGGVIISANK